MADNWLGERLAEFREATGLDQGKLAKMVHRDRSSINAWERGRRKIPLAVLHSLSGQMGLPLTIWDKNGPRPSSVIGASQKPIQGAVVPASQVRDALMAALGKTLAYASRDEPVPWREVSAMIAEVSEMLGLLESGTTPTLHANGKG